MSSRTTPLVFTHIPKAAGNTINIILQQNYLFRRGYTFSSGNVRKIGRFIALPENVRKKMVLVKGHLYYGVHRYCPMPVHYFTMLREPLSRAMSHYNYIYTIPHHFLFKDLNEHQYTLRQLLENGLIINLDNCQVRFLCGLDDIPFGGVNEQHLQMAIDNLEKSYERVGIMEHFDESLLVFAKKFNWSKPFYNKQNIATQQREKLNELDAETYDLLKHYNRFDELLYQRGLEILQQHIAEAGPGFTEEVARFRGKNKQLYFRNRIVTFFVRYASQLKYYLGLNKD